MKRVAIVGAGMCGLATAYFLKGCAVTLFDKSGVGGGASGICGGLIHPFRALEKIARMEAAFEEAKELLGPYLQGPLIRMKKNAEEDLESAASRYADVTFLKDVASYTDGRVQGPGLLFEAGGVVDTPAYLQDLFVRAECTLETREVESLEELNDFDVIVIAAGADSGYFTDLPLETVYGRALIYDIPPLPHGLLGAVYCASLGEGRLTIGATFEHQFNERHLDALRDSALLMLPELKSAPEPEVVVGARMRGPGRLPFAKRLGLRLWAVGGVGARGLLFHASLGAQIAKEIMDG